jgi:hypothetical protein
MPRAGLEPTSPVTKLQIYALDRAATRTGSGLSTVIIVIIIIHLVGWTDKQTLALRPFVLCIYVPICYIIIPYSSTRALWQLPAKISSSEAGETL